MCVMSVSVRVLHAMRLAVLVVLVVVSCVCGQRGCVHAQHEAKYYTQLVDHFTANDLQYFQQRYYVNDTWFCDNTHGDELRADTANVCRRAPFKMGDSAKAMGAIFVVVGGESEVTPDTALHYPFVNDVLAPKLGALVVQPEHRYYGTSKMPDGTSMSYLTPQQALADLADFTQFIRAEYNCTGVASLKEDTAALPYCPAIVVGGSYPGFLAAMARLRYPHVFQIGYASSAPLRFYSGDNDPYEYYKVVTTSADLAVPGCADAVRRSFVDIGTTCLRNGTSVADAASCLNLCMPTLPSYIIDGGLSTLEEEYAMAVMATFANLNMANYPPPFTTLFDACTGVVNDMQAPSSNATGGGQGATALHRLLMTFSSSNTNVTDCFDMATLLPDGTHATVTGGDWSGDGSGQSGLNWDFQTSTLLVENISTNNVTDMFPPREFSLDWLEQHAASRFGGVNKTRPRPSALVEEWGFSPDDLDEAGASRIIFTNGLNDGWSAGGILTSLSDSLIAVNIGNGAHHSDLSFQPTGASSSSSSADTSAALAKSRRRGDNAEHELELARESIIMLLTKWLLEYEKKFYDGGGDNGGGGGGDDNGGNGNDNHSEEVTKVVTILATLIAVLVLFLILAVLRLFAARNQKEEETLYDYSLVYDIPRSRQ